MIRQLYITEWSCDFCSHREEVKSDHYPSKRPDGWEVEVAGPEDFHKCDWCVAGRAAGDFDLNDE